MSMIYLPRYLAAFPEQTLAAFFAEFNKWELSEVLEDIARSSKTSSQALPLTSLSSATLYRMVSNWVIFSDKRILAYFATHEMPDTLSGWPDASVPPGLLVFLTIEFKHLRRWAVSRASKSSIISLEALNDSYLLAIDMIHEAMQRQLGTDAKLDSRKQEPFSFAQSSDFWMGLNAALRLLPPQWLKGSFGLPLEFRHTILSHLRVQTSCKEFLDAVLTVTHLSADFTHVFDCFKYLIHRLGKDMWGGETPGFPVTIFQTVKTNPSFERLLHFINPSSSHSPYFAWFQEFLSTIREHNVYGDTLLSVIDFLFEKDRDANFHELRPTLRKCALDVRM